MLLIIWLGWRELSRQWPPLPPTLATATLPLEISGLTTPSPPSPDTGEGDLATPSPDTGEGRGGGLPPTSTSIPTPPATATASPTATPPPPTAAPTPTPTPTSRPTATPPLPTATLTPTPSPRPPTATPPPTDTPTPALPQPGEIRPDDAGVPMAYIPAGEFTMGGSADAALAECKKYRPNPDECNRDWFTDEEPAHPVTLDAFWIDQYEVTNARYAECVAAGSCTPPAETKSYTRDSYYNNPEFVDYPVIYVDWNQAKSYCEWRGGRLPKEAEWEKAARGTDGRTYPWGNDFDGGRTNFCDKNCTLDWANKNYDDGYADTAPVGSYPAGVSS